MCVCVCDDDDSDDVDGNVTDVSADVDDDHDDADDYDNANTEDAYALVMTTMLKMNCASRDDVPLCLQKSKGMVGAVLALHLGTMSRSACKG